MEGTLDRDIAECSNAPHDCHRQTQPTYHLCADVLHVPRVRIRRRLEVLARGRLAHPEHLRDDGWMMLPAWR